MVWVQMMWMNDIPYKCEQWLQVIVVIPVATTTTMVMMTPITTTMSSCKHMQGRKLEGELSSSLGNAQLKASLDSREGLSQISSSTTKAWLTVFLDSRVKLSFWIEEYKNKQLFRSWAFPLSRVNFFNHVELWNWPSSFKENLNFQNYECNIAFLDPIRWMECWLQVTWWVQVRSSKKSKMACNSLPSVWIDILKIFLQHSWLHVHICNAIPKMASWKLVFRQICPE